MKRLPTILALVLLTGCATGASDYDASQGDDGGGTNPPGHDASAPSGEASSTHDGAPSGDDATGPGSGDASTGGGDDTGPGGDDSAPSTDAATDAPAAGDAADAADANVVPPLVDPPAPFPPVPNADQLAWQENELTMFVHFNMDTFGTSTIGTGKEDPNLFNPTMLDPNQWVSTAKNAGFKGMILTAKHHDGFCLWPTKATMHSVQYDTAWMNGKGDVVQMFSDACKAGGMKMGIYCSPYDLNAPSFTADPPTYSKLYQQQLTELMTNYGDVFEMWFDGHNATSVADWASIVAVPRTLQPHAILKQGPPAMPVREDIRWVGNELAHAPLTVWSAYPGPNMPGAIWFPVESDISMIGNWFWNPANTVPMALADLLDIYYFTVGRNSLFLLNVAPDRRGLFSDASVARLNEFHTALQSIFGTDLAAGKSVTASTFRNNDPAYGGDKVVDGDPNTYWATNDGVTTGTLEVDLGGPTMFNVVRLEEVIALGQRVESYQLDALIGSGAGTWQPLIPAGKGTTIGYRKLDRFPTVTASKVRLTIQSAYAPPTIRSFGVHLDTVSPAANFAAAHALQ
jgi:alpha-L-fucosidase